MGFRTRTAVGLAAVLTGLTMIIAPAASAAPVDEFPKSTNDANRVAETPHVNEVSKGPGTVTIEFVNPTYWLAYFEYRIDGVEVAVNPDHGFLDDVQYPGVCVEGDVDYAPPCEPDVITRTFAADATVEVRHALGGENDWYFDWTEFTVGPKPTTKNDCKKGGWETYGFANQGQCIKFVKAG